MKLKSLSSLRHEIKNAKLYLKPHSVSSKPRGAATSPTSPPDPATPSRRRRFLLRTRHVLKVFILEALEWLKINGLIFLALTFPPLSVLCVWGCHWRTGFNCVLCLTCYFPAPPNALYALSQKGALTKRKYRKRNAERAPWEVRWGLRKGGKKRAQTGEGRDQDGIWSGLDGEAGQRRTASEGDVDTGRNFGVEDGQKWRFTVLGKPGFRRGKSEP
ncbi:MAG: hypothetical protein M1820_005462 [Bogoriella megaspora]|nr:MAG: hypothetical protein M1820_005462 [Bogoriella megaspora]